MRLNNSVCAALFTLACAIVAVGQESKCTLKLAELPSIPELRGFRIGMTPEQIKARLPKLQLKPPDEFGFTSLNVFPDYEPGIDKAAFDGVRTVSLDLLDGRVFSVWIGYNKTFKWQTTDEFVAGIAAILIVPDSWRSKFRTRLLDCSDFTVAVIPVGESPSIKITDGVAKALLDKRRAAKQVTQP
jgi:hypothetical protein